MKERDIKDLVVFIRRIMKEMDIKDMVVFIRSRLQQGLDPRLSLDNLDHRSTRQSTAPWCRRLPRILGGPKGPSEDPGQVPIAPFVNLRVIIQ